MKHPIEYHEEIRNNGHIFLYCVGGRSSSTAFQRILNSSNEVWLWGEPRRLIDDIAQVVGEMRRLGSASYVKKALEYVDQSIKNNKHVYLYANAIGNLDETAELLISSVSYLLKPKVKNIKRFGFKDIEASCVETLAYLKEIYPNAFFMFCFRDPLRQWPSVNTLQWFKYKTIHEFLEAYARVSDLYLEFSTRYDLTSFVENEDLKRMDKVKQIIQYLNIKAIDTELINTTIGSHSGEPSDEHAALILKSTAYKNYKLMQKISAQFYEKSVN